MEELTNKTESSSWNYKNNSQRFEEEIRISKISVSVHQMLNWINNGQLEIDNANRVDLTWSNFKKTYYIETLLIRFPSPYIYMCEERDGSRTVIDGINRIATLVDFVNNGFRLGHLSEVEGLDNCCFEDLNYNIQRRFWDSTVDICIINSECSPWLRYDIYKRVNDNSTRMIQKYLYSTCKPALRRTLYRMEELWKTFFENTDYKLVSKHSLYKTRMLYQEMSVFWISSVIEHKRNNYLNEELVIMNFSLVNKLDDENLEEMFEDFKHSIGRAFDLFKCFCKLEVYTNCIPINFILIWSVIFHHMQIKNQELSMLAFKFNKLLSLNSELRNVLTLRKYDGKKLFLAIKKIYELIEKSII